MPHSQPPASRAEFKIYTVLNAIPPAFYFCRVISVHMLCLVDRSTGVAAYDRNERVDFTRGARAARSSTMLRLCRDGDAGRRQQ
jgi:hypothetical protein